MKISFRNFFQIEDILCSSGEMRFSFVAFEKKSYCINGDDDDYDEGKNDYDDDDNDDDHDDDYKNYDNRKHNDDDIHDDDDNDDHDDDNDFGKVNSPLMKTFTEFHFFICSFF